MSHATPDTFVPHFRIVLPADDPNSFAGFTAVVSPMFDLTRLHDDRPFEAHVSTACLPDIYVTRTIASATRYERNTRTIAKSGTDAVVVLVYLSGGYAFDIEGRTDTVQANDVAFFDLRRPLSIQTEHVDNISLVISRQRLSEVAPAVQDFHGFVLRAGAARDLLLAHMRAVVEVGHRLPAADAAALSDVTVRMVAASWNSMSRHTLAAARDAGLATLADIKQHIEHHLHRPELGPAWLQDEFNLSRATLYRMFEPIGGVAAFILERRMQRALQMITAPGSGKPRIKQLALDVGFLHPSAFSRAFKKQFGVSPQDVRLHQNTPTEASIGPWKVPPSVEPLVTGAPPTRPSRRPR